MRIAVGLGSSLGPRHRHLERAIRKLGRVPELRFLRCSRAYRTPPLRGGRASGWFLNAVALFESQAHPSQVLDYCVQLESSAHRRRVSFWGDRTLDLDILLAEDCAIQTASLTVPHPALRHRPFVLGPLLEVWPDAIDPTNGTPLAQCAPAPGPRPAPAGFLAV